MKSFHERSQSAALAGQRGVVLVIALLILVIISMLGAATAKHAISSEGINGNLRLVGLAGVAAETALRTCENAVLAYVNGGTPVVIVDYDPSPSWKAGAPTWDGTNASVIPVPLAAVNGSGSTTFARAPECIAERMVPATSPRYSSSFTITARGFGPEVPASDTRARPEGTEVFLQSTIEIN